jgi:hypothetical protein
MLRPRPAASRVQGEAGVPATAGPVFGYLLLGLIDLAAGVTALVWPGVTALVVVLIVAIWTSTGRVCRQSSPGRVLTDL